MRIPAIVDEVVDRLEDITAGSPSPAGQNYYFTPKAVYKGRHILDAEITDAPVYSVYRAPKVAAGEQDQRSVSSNQQWLVEITVEGRVTINDFDDPMLDAEKCLVDIESALCGADNIRQRNTLSDTAASFLLDSDDITVPDPDDKTVGFTATFAAIILTPRGQFN